ncbi:imidazoleglycerol-phosphate dehydratase [Ectobacillus ponti]|uniref:Imidazoleglycerol-phosphate dehydratase n=1 Tax=Ectobacillus ponti TaxID=2961894 RepID=A0AA41X846_9BACI|nr:imidazoleglycerol-phosphate dehydratase [Ectobacillus ponti]MCP8968630.1 imidazoleglycerol-phosphate dehydratase [Ectobacillus ponti]
MTSRNGSKGSKNQGSPQAGHYQMELGADFQAGDDNKGKTYRSHTGNKSHYKHED